MKKTIKLPINLLDNEKEMILKYQKNQNNVIRFTYNRLLENNKLTTAEITALQKTMNNIFVDSHFKNSSIYKAKELIEQGNGNVIFGGKKLFIQRCHGKISVEEFRNKKLIPIYSIGEANKSANRKFAILDTNIILFKPERSVHIEIKLPFLRKNIKKELEKLKVLQDGKKIPITYQLDCNNIYLSYDDKLVNEMINYRETKNRIMGIDLNPNYIGYSIVDWIDVNTFTIISNGLFDLTRFSTKSKELKRLKWELKQRGKDGDERKQIISNKFKHLNDQRDHETIEITVKLSNIFRGFNCNILGIEDLNIKSKDSGNGKNYNRMVNNEWLRNCLVDQLEKRMNRIKSRVIKILPAYSSFIGNLLYCDLNLPDPILSSIEIGRRAFEFNAQYIEKTKKKEKVIIFPDFGAVKHRLVKPLEGFGVKIDHFTDWKRLYGCITNSKVKYRVALESVKNLRDFSTICIKNKVVLYNFK